MEYYVRRLLILAILLFSVTGAHAETIQVKFLGPVDLSNYKCPNIKPDGDVRRICFDEVKKHLIVKLDRTYYNYCNMTWDVVTKWISSPDLGDHYRNYIITNNRSKGRTTYACPMNVAWLENYKNLIVVKVRYRGKVDLTSFDCPKLKFDKKILRICYNTEKKYMIALVGRGYYDYCDVGPNIYKTWASAPSLEVFYEDSIRVSSNDGLYDCRGKNVPKF